MLMVMLIVMNWCQIWWWWCKDDDVYRLENWLPSSASSCTTSSMSLSLRFRLSFQLISSSFVVKTISSLSSYLEPVLLIEQLLPEFAKVEVPLLLHPLHHQLHLQDLEEESLWHGGLDWPNTALEVIIAFFFHIFILLSLPTTWVVGSLILIILSLSRCSKPAPA